MEHVDRRRPGWHIRGARVLAAAVLLVFLASGGYALGSKDGESRNPSSRELGALAEGPYGTDPEPSGSWTITLPSPPKSEHPPVEPAAPKEPLSLTVEQAVATARDDNLGLVSPRIAAETKRRAESLAWNNFL
ncbi:MAG: hypothetical protein GX430_12380, partial [Treponema sp.]|nr:hypothetical protein [Treponema sp.]